MKDLDINNDTLKHLFQKFRSSSSSRYLFQPSISKWNNDLNESDYENHISESSDTFDLYIHIPFCSNFCTFCGCNIKTSTQEKDHKNLLEALFYEISIHKKLLKNKKLLNLYLGGGTPSLLSTDMMKSLLNEVYSSYNLSANFEGHIETTPYNLNESYITILKEMNIINIKIGIQDLNQSVLNRINRTKQSESLNKFLELKKKYNLKIQIELVAGLPNQTENSFIKSLDEIVSWDVETITIYPLAIKDNLSKLHSDLGFIPLNSDEKVNLMFKSAQSLLKKNFKPLGFDCYRSSNSIGKYKARSTFGFSTSKSDLLIGIGPSAISIGKKFIKRNENIYEKYLYLCRQNNLFNQSFKHKMTEKNILINNKIDSAIQRNEIDIETSSKFDSNLVENGQITNYGRLFLSSILDKLPR